MVQLLLEMFVLFALFEFIFTFHYGSITIKSININRSLYQIYIPLWFNYYKADNPNYATISTFTFHYGSITIIGVSRAAISRLDLHSIMVQLLFEFIGMLFSFVKKFTFHYGSITITPFTPTTSAPKTFTFHYGSITIIFQVATTHNKTRFTFHYGSITIRGRGLLPGLS